MKEHDNLKEKCLNIVLSACIEMKQRKEHSLKRTKGSKRQGEDTKAQRQTQGENQDNLMQKDTRRRNEDGSQQKDAEEVIGYSKPGWALI